MALSQYALLNFSKDDPKLFKRGEIAFKDGHVQSFSYARDICGMKGKVQASMKNLVYDVELWISVDGDTVVSQSCSCPRGQDICHHMIALALYGIHNVSKTDKECQWKKPKLAKEIQPVSVLFPKPKPFTALIENHLSREEMKTKMIYDLKERAPFTGMSWLLEPEPLIEKKKGIKNVEDILFSEECVNSDCPVDFVFNSLKLTTGEIEEIENVTRGQQKNPLWFHYRRCRVTASNFSKVVEQCSKSRFPPSFYKTLLGQYDIGKVRAVQWGLNHEAIAIREYEAATGVVVKPCGFFLHESGCIGASPDGLIGSDKIIEVKCPFSIADIGVSAAIDKGGFYLKKDDVTNKFILNLEHKQGFQYHHQVQATLFITNRSFCDLVVWTPKETYIVPIERLPTYNYCVETVLNFYQKLFIPKILPQNDDFEDE